MELIMSLCRMAELPDVQNSAVGTPFTVLTNTATDFSGFRPVQ
jgi:hypothetical protein